MATTAKDAVTPPTFVKSLQDLNNPSGQVTFKSWSSLLVPVLQGALMHSKNYDEEEIRHHVAFFTEHITPHLGPGPSVTRMNVGLRYEPYDQYPSSMTNDHTPFEVSLCWKSPSQDGHPIVRFIVDLVPESAEKSRKASLAKAKETIQALDKLSRINGKALELQVLSDIWLKITETLSDGESKLHPSGNCKQCGPSSTFLGFDLVRSTISSKLYWLLPSCLSPREVLGIVDRIFSACGSINEFFASHTFQESWQKIRDHIYRNHEILQVRMLSVDATLYPAPRIKLYTRCLFKGQRSFDMWKRHLTLDDQIPLDSDFESTSRNLWESVATNPKVWESSRPTAGPNYNLILYDLTASSVSTEAATLKSKISSKLYVMCQEIPRKDSFIAGAILRHCGLANSAPILRSFLEEQKPTNFICEIGLASRKEGTETSIYVNPSFFSRDDWAEEGDGFMSKYRIRLRQE